jgi:hypothetical protein
VLCCETPGARETMPMGKWRLKNISNWINLVADLNNFSHFLC